MPKVDRYPVVKPDRETLDYFRQNPTVAGMAIGAGLNGYSGARQIVVNPYTGLNKTQEGGLILNERLRHLMDEAKPELKFDPTTEQVARFKGTEYGKPENIGRLKETLVARIITGDESAGKITRPQSEAARKIDRLYNNAVTPTNPLSTAYQMDEPLPGTMLYGGRERVFPTKHPMVQNGDGSRSNVVIMGHSESKDGPVYAIPTMVEGKQLSPKAAVDLARSNGLQNYHKDMTPAEHNAWAEANHGNIGEDGFMKRKPGPSLPEAVMRRDSRPFARR